MPGTDQRSAPPVAIVITTRNRIDDLRRALRSCVSQNYRELDIFVYDDASETPVAALLQDEFPRVRFHGSPTPLGYIAYRDRALRDLESKYIFWLDDDAYYTCDNTVASVVAQMEQNSDLAAVALPFVEPLKTPQGQMAIFMDVSKSRCLRSFTGCAAALRRSSALEVGGLRTFLFIYGEERDLTIRLINHGYKIGYATTAPIVHLASPKRNKPAQDFYSVRNTILFDFLNLPARYLAPALLLHACKLFRYKLAVNRVPHRIWSIFQGFLACLRFWRHRRPVSIAAYRLYQSCPGHGPEPASESHLGQLGNHNMLA